MTKTVGDKIKDFYINYVAPTKEELKKGSKELRVTRHSKDSRGNRKNSGFLTKSLSPKEQRVTAEQAPLLMKGIRKKCMDGTRAWLNLEILPDRGKSIREDLQIIYNFEKRNNFKSLWNQIKMDSYIYGDGYLLITFEKDDKTELWEKPPENAVPWKVEVMDSEHINEIEYYPKKKKYFEKLQTMHYHYLDRSQNKNFWIHPDRIIHMAKDQLAYHQFGNSAVNLLRNVIKSKVNVDISAGEILAWFAHGVYDIAIPGCEEEDVTYWTKIANTHPGAWIHGDDEKLTAVNPVAINPKPFYDYIVMNIAAALIMPTHLLVGIQVGKVTGAEIGFGDYYKDVKDFQELVETPLLEKLYKTILERKGRVWKYNIKWNPIYIDELAEAEIMGKRVIAAETALNGTKGVGGFIDQEESREIFNKGQIKLDTKKKIKPRTPPIAPKPDMPVPKMTPKVKELKGKEADKADADRLGISLDEYYKQKKDIYTYQLDEATKAMINKRKEVIAKEKKLGKAILKEQGE